MTDQFGRVVSFCHRHAKNRFQLHASYRQVTEADAIVFEIMHR